MNKTILLMIVVVVGNLTASDLAGVDYGYLPIQAVNRTGTEEQIHDLNQFGIYYNKSITKRLSIGFATDYYFKQVYGMSQNPFLTTLSASLWEDRIGTDICLVYNIDIKKWFEISIGSGIGEGLIWETYYLQYVDQSTRETDKENISFWGMSPYFKGSLFINRELYKRVGIRFGIDFIYSETRISNADYSLDKFPALDIYINAMTKSNEHRFVFRFGISYAI